MARPASMYALDDPSVVGLRTLNACLYGWPGCGKTVLLGTGNERMFIMDSDDGIDSARAMRSKARAAPCKDYDDLNTLYEWLAHDAAKEAPELKTIAWDSLTLFQDRAIHVDEILPL